MICSGGRFPPHIEAGTARLTGGNGFFCEMFTVLRKQLLFAFFPKTDVCRSGGGCCFLFLLLFCLTQETQAKSVYAE